MPRRHYYTPDPKDVMRIHDLVTKAKAKGDYTKISSLAKTMAMRITEPRKAAARALAADSYANEMLGKLDAESFTGLTEACEIFTNRAKELGVDIDRLKELYGLGEADENTLFGSII